MFSLIDFIGFYWFYSSFYCFFIDIIDFLGSWKMQSHAVSYNNRDFQDYYAGD